MVAQRGAPPAPCALGPGAARAAGTPAGGAAGCRQRVLTSAARCAGKKRAARCTGLRTATPRGSHRARAPPEPVSCSTLGLPELRCAWYKRRFVICALLHRCFLRASREPRCARRMAAPWGGGFGAGEPLGGGWLAEASPAADAPQGAGGAFGSPPLQPLSALANAVAAPPAGRGKLPLMRRSDGLPAGSAPMTSAQLSAASAHGAALAPARAPAAPFNAPWASAAAPGHAPASQLAAPVLPFALRGEGGNGAAMLQRTAPLPLMPVLGSDSDDDAPNFDLGLADMLAPAAPAWRAQAALPSPHVLMRRSPRPDEPRVSPPPSTVARRQRPPRAPLLVEEEEEEAAPRGTPEAAGSDSDTPLPQVLPPSRRAAPRRASQRLSQQGAAAGAAVAASQDSEPLPFMAMLSSGLRAPRPQQQPAVQPVAQPRRRAAPPPPPPAAVALSDDDDDDDAFFAAPPRTKLKRLRRASAPVVILSDSDDEPPPPPQRRKAAAVIAVDDADDESDGVEEASDDGSGSAGTDGSDDAGEEGGEDDWDDAGAGAGAAAGGGGGDSEWETWPDEGDEFGGGAGTGGGADAYDFGAARGGSDEDDDDDDFRAPPPPSRGGAQQAQRSAAGRSALPLSKPAAGAPRWPTAAEVDDDDDDDDDDVQIIEPPEESWRSRLPHLVTCAQIERSGFRVGGERVHIDYRRQFGGASRVSAPASGGAGGGASARGRGGAAAPKAAAPKTAHWVTEGGRKVYKTADGRTLTGKKAWAEYQKA